MEEDYIIPERNVNWPERPPRGSKIYEKAEMKKIEDSLTAESKEQEIQQENSYEVISPVPEPEPTRPTRGIKIYETIIIKKAASQNKGINEEDSKSTSKSTENLIDKCEERETPVSSGEISAPISTPPSKSINDVTNEDEAIKANEAEDAAEPTPVKPKRGIKNLRRCNSI